MSDNKLGLADKVLFDFNPTTSVLNQVRTIKNGFQNTRVLIEKVDKTVKESKTREVRNKIKYNDLMTFK